jgi:hypothetical protein
MKWMRNWLNGIGVQRLKQPMAVQINIGTKPIRQNWGAGNQFVAQQRHTPDAQCYFD